MLVRVVARSSRGSMAPATTAPGPGAAPAIATSSGERFSPGTNVSANASRVMVLLAVSAEVSKLPPVGRYHLSLRIVLSRKRDNFSCSVLSRTLPTESKQREERRIGGEI